MGECGAGGTEIFPDQNEAQDGRRALLCEGGLPRQGDAADEIHEGSLFRQQGPHMRYERLSRRRGGHELHVRLPHGQTMQMTVQLPVWWRPKACGLTRTGGEVCESAWERNRRHWGEALTGVGEH